MKRLFRMEQIVGLVASFASLLCGCTTVGDTPGDEFSEEFSDFCDYHHINSAAYRIESGDGKIVWQGCYGNMYNDTPYALASITKMYTVAVILNLDSEGVINLDDPISQYLSSDIMTVLHVYDGVDYSNRITIRHLATHTSGLPDYYSESSSTYQNFDSICENEGDFSYTFQDIITRTKALSPQFAPGTKGKAWYSDANFQLLGKIIENVTGKSLQENFDKYIFTPLGLHNTYLFEEGMDWDNISLIDFPCGLEGRPLLSACEKTAGGIISTTEEVMKFIKAFYGGNIFPEKYLQEMYDFNDLQYFNIDYGMGMMKWNDKYILYGHSGSFGTIACYEPKSDVYIVGTLNNCNTYQARRLVIKFLQIIK